MIELRLPIPPSTNSIYRKDKSGGIHLSSEVKSYREIVAYECLEYRNSFTALDRLSVSVVVTPANRRRRDLDNLLKSLLDALEAAEVYPDDFQVDELSIRRREFHKPGWVDVSIAAVTPKYERTV